MNSPSSSRIPNPCIYSDRCGSCQWLGSSYELQTQWKKQFILDALKKFGGQDLEQLDEFVPSPKELNYRNRVRLHVDISNQKIKLGYFARKSHQVISIKQCMIADNPINQAIATLSSLDCRSLPIKIKARFEVSLHVLQNNKVLCRFISKNRLPTPIYTILSQFKKSHPENFIFDQDHSKNPEFHHIDTYRSLRYGSFGEQFQQINTEGNHLLKDEISRICENIQPKTIVDLFCGSGNLSMHLAHSNRNLIGIERNPKSIIAAQKNIVENKIVNAQYYAMDSEQFIGEKLKQYLPIDLLIVDPPRQGLGEFVTELPQYDATHIVYVSCDPNTLGRDTAKITSYGYKVERVCGFDFFPQTYHVESLILFTKT